MRNARIHLRSAMAALGLSTAAAPVAAAQIAVLSSTVEESVATPGAKLTGRIVIANPGPENQAVRIYQTDYRFTADGTSNFDEPGTQARSNASWVVPQSNRVIVPAGGEIALPYSITVPSSDTISGTYWSTIMVEASAPPPADPHADSPAAPRLGLSTILRYAVQVATHVGSAGTRTLNFDNAAAGLMDNGRAAMELDVINTGSRAYRPTLWVELYDAEGSLRSTTKQTRGLLYPATSLRQQFAFGEVPPGTYKALVFADTGAETILARQFTLKF